MRRTVNTLESSFSEICENAYPHEWDENHLSFLLMRRLREIFSERVIHFNNWSKIVDWKSFKNRGKQETKYGDIALLVHVQFSTGEYLKGVANIEAKRSFNTGNFESVDLSQLDRLLLNLPYVHLLLYNHQRMELQLKFPDEHTWKSNLWISPINTANQIFRQMSLSENAKILRTSFPFTMFLTSRIFWGFDLDFRDEVYKDIVEGINRIVNPSYLGIVNVYYDHQRPIEIRLSELWEAI